MRYLDIDLKDLRDAQSRLSSPCQILGHLAAMSVSGNDVSGSVFYAFPLVFAAAGTTSLLCPIRLSDDSETGIYSPICLLTASLLLLFFRPVLLELASTVRINGSYVSFLRARRPSSRHFPGTTSTSSSFRAILWHLLEQPQRF